MHLLGPSLLLFEYVAFSDASSWKVIHPPVLYAWEGACVWIPCTYTIPGNGLMLENLTVYHNYQYNASTRDFAGTVLYNITELSKKPENEEFPWQKRVQFLGNRKYNCTLRIHPVSVNDSGWLGLRMMTKGDRWMENVTLNISETAPPPFIELPHEMQESQTASLICSLQSACFGYYIGLQWSLEGEVTNSTNLNNEKISTQSQLKFQPEWTHHGKNVTCQLWDLEKGQLLSEASVVLDVKHTPKLHIEVSPQDAVVVEGSQVTMSCHVTSSNPGYHNVSWVKDGKPLTGRKVQQEQQERLILTLSSVTKDMHGDYQCEASNALGTGQSVKVTLQVQYPPEPSKVQITPSEKVKEGNPVRLTCVSSANPAPTSFSWFHDGQALQERSQTLQITDAHLSHTGTYSCLAENALGHGQRGQESLLDVQYPPKKVKAVIESPAEIREGDHVKVRCEYNSSNPAVTRYEWTPRAPQGSSEVLHILNVAWDTGTVSCTACNRWCSSSPPVDLQVQYAPRDVTVVFSTSPVVHAGHRLLLNCSFSSSHPAAVRVRWTKNGSFLREGRELHFDAIMPEDAGMYLCEVNNSIGRKSAQARVSVLYAPRRVHVSVSPQGGAVEGQRAVLRCESDANPPVRSYAWFDGNNQDLHHFEQTLRLEPVKTEHSGVYWCQGTNELGLARSPPTTFRVSYSTETIVKHTTLVLGLCLAISCLATWGVRLQQRRKRLQSQQDLPGNASGRSFFVRNKKAMRTPLVDNTPSLGCYNPGVEGNTSYAVLSFPDTPRNSGTSRTQEPPRPWGDTVTYSVVKKRPVGDYENVTPDALEDEGIHYSELVQFGGGARFPAPEPVEYVTLKH